MLSEFNSPHVRQPRTSENLSPSNEEWEIV